VFEAWKTVEDIERHNAQGVVLPWAAFDTAPALPTLSTQVVSTSPRSNGIEKASRLTWKAIVYLFGGFAGKSRNVRSSRSGLPAISKPRASSDRRVSQKTQSVAALRTRIMSALSIHTQQRHRVEDVVESARRRTKSAVLKLRLRSVCKPRHPCAPDR
jgi:hypothetical protein